MKIFSFLTNQPDNVLTRALGEGKRPFIVAATFSFFTNLLYLALPLYTYQVYGRVMISQNQATLWMLTLVTIFVFFVSSAIDDFRARILINYGAILDQRVSGRLFSGLFDAAVRGDASARSQALRDLDTFRTTLTGVAAAAFFDLPWIPVFVLVLFLINFMVGMVALVGGGTLLALALMQERAIRPAARESTDAALKSYAFTEAALRNGEVVRAMGMLPTLGAAWARHRAVTIERGAAAAEQSNFYTDIIKSAFNLKFDAESIAKYYGEAPVPPYQDVIVAKSLLNENPPHGLEYCVPAEFNFRYDKVGKILHTLPFSAAADYSHLDSKYGWLLRRSYLRRLAKEGLLEYFLMECDVTEVLVNTEMVGAPVRLDEVDELDGYLREEMDQIAGDLFAEAGEEFSLTAGADKAWFIYEVREHEPTMFTEKKHEPSTAAAALEQYTHDPMVAKLMRWNDLHKLHSTYVVNLQKYAALDGRIHADFKQHGTRTGRFSCGEPNLQNIPKPDTPEGKRIRGLFWAGSDDECLVVGDYSQIELRVLAHYTGDPTMMQAFFDGEDIHQASADTLGCDRGIAKNINFAIPFGAGYRASSTNDWLLPVRGFDEQIARSAGSAAFARGASAGSWSRNLQAQAGCCARAHGSISWSDAGSRSLPSASVVASLIGAMLRLG